jgi:hypothetical protein
VQEQEITIIHKGNTSAGGKLRLVLSKRVSVFARNSLLPVIIQQSVRSHHNCKVEVLKEAETEEKGAITLDLVLSGMSVDPTLLSAIRNKIATDLKYVVAT